MCQIIRMPQILFKPSDQGSVFWNCGSSKYTDKGREALIRTVMYSMDMHGAAGGSLIVLAGIEGVHA